MAVGDNNLEAIWWVWIDKVGDSVVDEESFFQDRNNDGNRRIPLLIMDQQKTLFQEYFSAKSMWIIKRTGLSYLMLIFRLTFENGLHSVAGGGAARWQAWEGFSKLAGWAVRYDEVDFA